MVTSKSGTNLVGGRRSSGEREKDDFYATPTESTQALLDAHKITGKKAHEPCCGMGHISELLAPHFKKVLSTDLVYRGYGKKTPIDFLTHDYKDKKFDWVITNPPFKHAQEFIEKSLSITNKGVAMFLKIQFLEGVKRKEFFEANPLKYVYVFSGRQQPMKDGAELDPNGKKWSGTMCFAWFVWEKDFNGETMVRWL